MTLPCVLATLPDACLRDLLVDVSLFAHAVTRGLPGLRGLFAAIFQGIRRYDKNRDVS